MPMKSVPEVLLVDDNPADIDLTSDVLAKSKGKSAVASVAIMFALAGALFAGSAGNATYEISAINAHGSPLNSEFGCMPTLQPTVGFLKSRFGCWRGGCFVTARLKACEFKSWQQTVLARIMVLHDTACTKTP